VAGIIFGFLAEP